MEAALLSSDKHEKKAAAELAEWPLTKLALKYDIRVYM